MDGFGPKESHVLLLFLCWNATKKEIFSYKYEFRFELSRSCIKESNLDPS